MQLIFEVSPSAVKKYFYSWDTIELASVPGHWMTSSNFLLINQITDISVALYKMEQNFKTNEKKIHPHQPLTQTITFQDP